jgi:hypothetical protein
MSNPEDIFDTILRLYGQPGIDKSFLPNLKQNPATGEVRVSYGESDSSLDKIVWKYGREGD